MCVCTRAGARPCVRVQQQPGSMSSEAFARSRHGVRPQGRQTGRSYSGQTDRKIIFRYMCIYIGSRPGRDSNLPTDEDKIAGLHPRHVVCSRRRAGRGQLRKAHVRQNTPPPPQPARARCLSLSHTHTHTQAHAHSIQHAPRSLRPAVAFQAQTPCCNQGHELFGDEVFKDAR